MNKFTNGQEIKVISGTHAGKVGWFNKPNAHREGKCFIWFKSANVAGAQVSITDLVAA
jgi:hypothetical protein